MTYQDDIFQQRERLLLNTALSLFRTHGWESVTVAQVAAAAGIGKGTVYRHFASKEGIYARIALDFSSDCLARYCAVPLGDSPLGAMRRTIRLAFDVLSENPMEVQLCQHCERPEFQERLDDSVRQAFCDLDRDYKELFNQLLDAAVQAREISPKPVEPLYWGVDAAFQGVMAHVAAGGFGGRYHELSRDHYFDYVADFIMSGIIGSPAIGRTGVQGEDAS